MKRKKNIIHQFNDNEVKNNLLNNEKVSKLNQYNWKLIALIASISVVLCSVVFYSELENPGNTTHINEGGWIHDNLFEKESSDVGCDIPILNYSEINWNKLNNDELISTPFIVKGNNNE